MKKKFDFSTEMAEAEAIKSNPKNESLEEENHLFDINVQELAKLNNNVFKLRTEVENLSGSIRECKPIISLNPEKPDVPLNKNDAFQKVQKRRVQEKR